MNQNKKSKILAYAGLIFVILVWGVSPLTTLYFYKYFSPTVRIAFGGLVSTVALLIISSKKLGELDKTHLKLAIPTGIFLASANILQKIGLQYTTPTHYSFLENLSCIVVPFLVFLLIRKKPTFLTVFASVLCLVSAFILTGMESDMKSISAVGDLLCALAGIFYGVNIAVTGVYAKKLNAPLYLMLQSFIEMTVATASVFVFDATGIEQIKFTLSLPLIIINAVWILIGSTFCWLIRTNSMKHVDPTVVAVMMPFSSIVTTVCSIIAGKDSPSLGLFLGVALGLIAIILSELGGKEKPQRLTLPKGTENPDSYS